MQKSISFLLAILFLLINADILCRRDGDVLCFMFKIRLMIGQKRVINYKKLLLLLNVFYCVNDIFLSIFLFFKKAKPGKAGFCRLRYIKEL